MKRPRSAAHAVSWLRDGAGGGIHGHLNKGGKFRGRLGGASAALFPRLGFDLPTTWLEPEAGWWAKFESRGRDLIWEY